MQLEQFDAQAVANMGMYTVRVNGGLLILSK